MKLSELLTDIELIIKFFEGVDPNHEVRLAVQPGVVDVVAEPAPASETTEPAPEEQKEGE